MVDNSVPIGNLNMNHTMRILIGYDGSDCAEAALDDLQRAGLPPKAEALVLSVAEVWLPPPASSANDIVDQTREAQILGDREPVYAKASALVKEAFEQADRGSKRVQTNFPGWKVTADAAYGSPAWELVARADRWKPDLAVVGSHGQSVWDRLVLGSVAQRVVTEASCSVRVARGRVEEPGVPVRLVVGLDGSPGSHGAIRAIAERSWLPGSEARVIVADDPRIPTFIGNLIPPVAAAIEESNLDDQRWIEGALSSSVSILNNAGMTVSTEIREGDPKRVLVEVAEEWGADCIFVGSTGFSNRLERFVLGSVSAAVVARAHCSVEVVRKPK